MQGLAGIKKKYEGKIVTGNTGNVCMQYAAAREELLAGWDPVGHTAGEVEFVIGPPSKQRRDGLVYHFENGEVGVQCELKLKDGVVVGIERMLMD